jgi:hypothetical protein
MNIIDKTDEEILAIAHPMWDDLVKFSNNSNYALLLATFQKIFYVLLMKLKWANNLLVAS